MKNSRRQYFIDRAFQTKFILNFSAVVIISSIIIGFVTIFLTKDSTTVAIENTRIAVKNTADFIFPIISWILVIMAVFSAVVVALISLFVSHKIAGPLFRMKKEIDLLAEGDLKRNFNLRSKDQLQELSKSLGKLTKALKENRSELNEKVARINSYLNEKNFTINMDDRQYFSDLLADLQSAIDAFRS